MAFPTTETFIKATEAKLGVLLPAWLRSRLIAENGGTVEAADDYWELFSVFDTTDRKRIARSSTNIPGETMSAREWPGFPSSAVAIAANGSGDYLVLFPATDNSAVLASTVYLWLHDANDPPVPVEVSHEPDAI